MIILTEQRRKTDKKKRRSPLYFGARDIDFKQVQEEIDHHNRKLFPEINAVSAIALAVLLLIAAVTGEDGPLAAFFIPLAAFSIIFVALFFLSAHVRKTENHKAILACCYATVAALYALTICLGPVYDTHQLSMTFFVVLFATPIIIADAPVRVTVVSIIASAVFVTASYLNKEFSLFVYDVISCGMLLLVSILVGFDVQKMRLKLFMKLKQTEYERDTDGLTNVWEKKSGEQKIRETLEQQPHTRGAMVIMDVDDFKQVNDQYGHDHGDTVLRKVGAILNESFRKDDILVRFGGDEFVLYLSGIDSHQEVRECAHRISDTLQKSNALPDGGTVSCSFGAAFFPEDGDDYDTLLQRADKALYLAKYLGKDKLRFYQEER